MTPRASVNGVNAIMIPTITRATPPLVVESTIRSISDVTTTATSSTSATICTRRLAPAAARMTIIAKANVTTERKRDHGSPPGRASENTIGTTTTTSTSP